MNEMKRLISTILLVLPCMVYSQLEVKDCWSFNTAYVLGTKKWEKSIFQPLRIGLRGNNELQIHPLLFPIYPNLKLKHQYKSKRNIILSSKHGVAYTSPLLKAMARPGMGGLIATQFEIPPLFTIHNSLLVSKLIKDSSLLLTAKIGFDFALGKNKLDPMASVDFPLIFPRLAPVFRGPTSNIGLGVRGKIYKDFNFGVNANAYLIANKNETLFLENTVTIQWAKWQGFKVNASYKFCYGEFPFGNQWHFFPGLDLIYTRK
jgi:hypothetical protein